MEEFSPPGRAEIRNAVIDGNLLVSAISAWEVGMLESKGRISLSIDCERWVDQALAMPGLRLVPLTPKIMIESTRLPGEFEGSLADYMLIATARIEGARLMTKDRQILRYGRAKHVRVLHA
jgi:PIN domain nuclease of toxin-antitoxin system